MNRNGRVYPIIRVFPIYCLSSILLMWFCILLYSLRSMDKVLELVSRQMWLQRVLRWRLRKPWSQSKSQIVVFNQVEFYDLTVCEKLYEVSSRAPKVRFFHLARRELGMDEWRDFSFKSTNFSTPFNRLKEIQNLPLL